MIARNTFGDSPASQEAAAAALRSRFWDGGTANLAGNGNGTSAGGNGTWNTTLTNWDAGAAPYVSWDNAANDGAVFGGSAGTVTLGAGITVGGLIFDMANYTLTGETLAFGIAGSIQNSGTATINCPIAGGPAAQISKHGTGILIFGADNSYQGKTIIHTGTLRFHSAGAIGGSGRSVTVADNAVAAFNFPISNAVLSRLAESDNAFEIHMLVPAGSTDLDLGGSAGANLPNITLRGQPNSTYSGILAANGVFRIGNLSAAASFGNANVFTVASALTGQGNSVVIAGGSSQPVYLTGTNTYGGTTTVSAGAALGFNTANIDGIGGGPGSPDIIVGQGASLLRQGGSLNNAYLQRIAETANEITIYSNNASCGNALDLSGTNGGRYLPKASLAFWDNAGTRTFQFTGTITPADDTYRFGGARATNFINLPNLNSLTGPRSLVVDGQSGVRVRLYNANDFSGETLVKAGTLYLLHSLSLQNSTIDTAGGGVLDVSGDRQPSTPNTPVTDPVIGGLKGAKNIAAVFNSSYLSANGTGVTSLTLKPGEGVVNAYAGSISNGAPNMALVKTGSGTQVLAGENLHTGPTAVQDGILLVTGAGSLAAESSVTVSGGTLGGDGAIGGSVTVTEYGSLSPGAPVGTMTIGGDLDLTGKAAAGETAKLHFDILDEETSDRIAVAGTLAIGEGTLGFDDFDFSSLGTLQAGVYKLITSGGITGSLSPGAQLFGMIDDFEATLRINGNDLELVIAPGETPYHVWAHGFAGLDDENPALDFDGGGLATALEWVLGGDPTDASDDASIAPTVDNASDPEGKLLFIFRRTAAARDDPQTTVVVEYGSDLGATGWTTAVHQGDGANEITIAELTDGFAPGIDKVTIALPLGLAAGGKMFARLKAGVTIP